MPDPGTLGVPGAAPPVAAPGLIPINYEQPSLPNTPSLTTSSQDNAPVSGLLADSIVGTGQPPSGSYYPPSSDGSILSQLPATGSSDGGFDTPFDQTNAFSSS